MRKKKKRSSRGKYILEFKLEAVQLVKDEQAVPVTTEILGMPVPALVNWGSTQWQKPTQGSWFQTHEPRTNGAGSTTCVGCATEKGERDLKKATAHIAQNSL